MDNKNSIQAFNYLDWLEILEYREEDLNIVREKIGKYQEVPKYISNGQILTFLSYAKGNTDEASKRIRTYFKCKTDMPEFFKSRNPESEEISQCFDNQYYATLPVTPDNCNVFFTSLSNFDVKNYIFNPAVKTFIMMSEAYLYVNGPRPESIFVFDLKGVSFWHIFKPSFYSRMKGMYFLENASPIDVKKIHILNSVSFINYIFALVRPFTSTGMLSRIQLHKADMNWDDFYRDHIPKSHLPRDYGGDLETLKELHDKERKTLIQLKKYFELEERQINREFDHMAEDSKYQVF